MHLQVKAAALAEGMSEENAEAKVVELVGESLDLAKVAGMLPSVCRGSEDKAKAILERHGVSL